MGPSLYKQCVGYISIFVIILIYLSMISVEDVPSEQSYVKREVQIWGKAAIAEYLWFHILNGRTDSVHNGFYNNGNLTESGLTFYYLSGPGYIQTTVPQNVEYLVLVLNGHTYEHVTNALNWLEYVPRLSSLKKLAVVILGSENCQDDWIIKFLKSNGGPIDVLFIVYDSPLVDDKEVFQWPLGVATYRHFPNHDSSQVNLSKRRKFTCNFAGTVYKGSSRETIKTILKNPNFKHDCLLLDRDEWPPKESQSSLDRYVDVLNSSDFTLCPAGSNTECYRIYEAISLGSTPLVENVMTPGKCVAPLRLLKKHNPPIIFIQDWNKLDETLKNAKNIKTMNQKADLIKWYHNFKTEMKKHFLKVINEKFFSSESQFGL